MISKPTRSQIIESIYSGTSQPITKDDFINYTIEAYGNLIDELNKEKEGEHV